MKTVIALYNSYSEAQQIARELTSEGFAENTIDIISNDTTSANETLDGGNTHNLIDRLTSLDVPRDEAESYAESVRRGGTLVSVRADDSSADRAADTMERAASLEREGDITAAERGTVRTRDENTIEIAEEELRVGKRQVERGGVRVHTYVVEEPVEKDVRLREEHVHVERRPVNRPVREAGPGTFKEKTIEVAETAEQPVVEKRARVVEEVVIRKDVDERTETMRDTVRRMDVEVEDVDHSQGRSGRGFDAYESDFHRDYENSFADRGYTYNQYRPAYRYGYNLATNDHYQGRSWEEVEPEARRDWEEINKGTWDEFKDAVRRGWEKVTGHA